MIEIAAVLISPFKSVFAQDFGEAVKKYRVVRANRVVGDREFECQRDERERDYENGTRIAIGVHPERSSSFSALVILKSGADHCQPSTMTSGTSSKLLTAPVDGSVTV